MRGAAGLRADGMLQRTRLHPMLRPVSTCTACSCMGKGWSCRSRPALAQRQAYSASLPHLNLLLELGRPPSCCA